jgi:hypothetical protein
MVAQFEPALRGLKVEAVGRSGHVPAAIHADVLAGDVAVAGEHHDNIGNFIHVPETANRDTVRAGFRVARNHLRFNQRRGNRVSRDTFLSKQGRRWPSADMVA